MTFLDHLEELRRRILWAVVSVAAACAGCCAVLACVVCAAILTPTTDFGNMLVIAGPMIVLYTAGIGVAWVFGRERAVE